MSLNSTHETDIVVAGTGPAGLMAALALARASDLRVSLLGPPPRLDDRRTTALMGPALGFLRSLGVLDEIEADAAPIRVMRIVDATARLVRGPAVTFRADEIGEPFFGLNIPNASLLRALAGRVAGERRIGRFEGLVEAWTTGEEKIVARLADGAELTARLAVAADGRSSPARAAAGIEISPRSTGQSALVLAFGHEREHGFASTEFHTEDGPFTQVPLPGRRSSLVWVMRPERAETLAALDDAILARQIEDRMQSMLGRVELEPGRQVYPLASAMPRRFAAHRVALVGEAAHVFPPIGAQGLNLGIRDIEQLCETVRRHAGDPGSPEAMRHYDLRRRPDILARSTAVDMLNRSLLSDLLPAQVARAAGLNMLGAFAPLRAFFMREGLRTGNGFSALFPGLGK